MSSVKVVAVGDGTVGKTSTLMSYSSNRFPHDYTPTVFDNVSQNTHTSHLTPHTSHLTSFDSLSTSHDQYQANLLVDGRPVSMCLWDTAGQGDYDRLRPLSYRNTDCFLLMFSVINPESFFNITNKWVIELNLYCPQAPIVLVGTQIDMRGKVQENGRDKARMVTSLVQGEQLAKEIGAVKYVECSAMTQEGLKQVFELAVRAALKQRLVTEPKGCCTIL